MDRDNVEVPEFFKIPFCIFEKRAHMRGFETIVLLDIMRNSAISLWVCVCFSTISFSQSKLSSSPTALRARSSKCEISVCVASYIGSQSQLYPVSFRLWGKPRTACTLDKSADFEGGKVHFWQEAIDGSPSPNQRLAYKLVDLVFNSLVLTYLA